MQQRHVGVKVRMPPDPRDRPELRRMESVPAVLPRFALAAQPENADDC